MGFCNRSMFCCLLLNVHSSFAIILMGKRELVALLSSSFWCQVIVVWLFLVVPWVCLQFVIVLFTDHTHLLFVMINFVSSFMLQTFFHVFRLIPIITLAFCKIRFDHKIPKPLNHKVLGVICNIFKIILFWCTKCKGLI